MVALAVAVTWAIPAALLTAELLESAALAPLAGTVKVIVAPETGLLFASLTMTASGMANTELTLADCEPPELIVIEAPESEFA